MSKRFGIPAVFLTLCMVWTIGMGAASQPQATAQTSPPSVDPFAAGRPALRVYSDRDGLPQNSTERLTIDRHGYLWTVTREGAAVYNGRSWTAVDMPNRTRSNFPRSLLAASDGSIWFGTDGDGVHRYRDGVWEASYDIDSGLPANRVMSLAEVTTPTGDHEIWAGTGRGPARFDGTTWTAAPIGPDFPSGAVLSLEERHDAKGESTVWAGVEGGLASWRAGTWTVYTPVGDLASKIVYGVFESDLIDGHRRLWAMTGDGLAYIDGTRLVLTQPDPRFAHKPIRAALQTTGSDGVERLWLATEGAGVALLQQGRWELIDAARGLPSNYALTLLNILDERGSQGIWIGTMTGLARLRQDGWTSFDAETPLSDKSVVALLETVKPDGGSVMWFGTLGDGLYRLDGEQWSVVRRKDGISGDSVFCLLETRAPSGESLLWAGTEDGLSRFDGRRWQTVITKDQLPNGENISCLLETTAPDGERTLWAGTFGGGVIRIRGGERTLFNAQTTLPDNRVEWMLETVSHDGARTLWIATDGGLVVFRDGVWSTLGAQSGLPSNEVRSLLETRSPDGRRRLWVGTGSGVAFRATDDDATPWRVLSDTTEPALPNNVVYQIRQDAQGRVYLFTNRGVARLSQREGSDEFDLSHFTTYDGLPSNECNFGASCVDRRGRLWVGTVEGAAGYDPSRERFDRVAKPLRIEQATVVDPDDAARGVPLLNGASLSHTQDRVMFEYALLSYYGEHETRYRTQLIGFDREPRDWSTQFTREFTNLSAGEYTFLVWGRDYAGNVSGPVTVAFTIRPAPWRTWWAFAAYALLLSAAIYGGFRFRLRTLNRRTAHLEARIADRTAQLGEKVDQLEASERRALESERRALDASHTKSIFLANMSHELRTPLNAILGFVQLMERSRDRTAEDRKHLSIITHSGEHLLGLINDILSISKIEAGKLALVESVYQPERLLAAAQEMTLARAETKQLKVVVEITPTFPKFVLGDEGKLRQVLINLLGNAVKFTESGSVTLRARWENGRGFFEVVDTGHGIADDEMARLFVPFEQTRSGMKAVEGTGLGLSISLSFVHLMGGDITVESEVGRGSRFVFDVAMPAAEGRVDTHDNRPRPIRLEDGEPAYRILVVDDSWENRTVLARMLEPAGFEVREAANGAEAIDVWSVWHPHLIWMDIRMPLVDGYQATHEIRNREAGGHSRTAIIALTASVFEREQEVSLARGFDGFAAKPIREAEVFEKIAEHLGARFVYEQAHAVVHAPIDDSERLAKRLADVPDAIRARLGDALEAGDVEEALSMLDAVGATDDQLAADLRHLVRRYQFERVLDLLQAAGKS